LLNSCYLFIKGPKNENQRKKRFIFLITKPWIFGAILDFSCSVLIALFFGCIFNELHPNIDYNLPDRCRFNHLFDKEDLQLNAILIFGCNFCRHNNYFYQSLVFPEHKTVGRMEKCLIVDV
jgi:hypothetical protein